MKELSESYEGEVFDFLITYKNDIPGASLSYAFEKMSKNKKKMILKN